MRIFVIILVVAMLFAVFFVNPDSSSMSIDSLSDEQLKVLDNAPIDTSTKYKDLLLPDGRNMKDWGEENDPNWEPTFD